MMRFRHKFTAAAIILYTLSAESCTTRHGLNVSTATVFVGDPSEGSDKGLSGMFYGVVNDLVVMGGGCNFPGIPAAEGGNKRFYDGIWAWSADTNGGNWFRICDFDEPVAYGMSVQDDNRLVFIGGTGPSGASKSVRELTIRDGFKLALVDSLPTTRDNGAACLVNGLVYVIGGNSGGIPSDAVTVRDSSGIWKDVAHIPDGPRLQPTCSSVNGRIYIFGGYFSGNGSNEAQIRRDGWEYDPERDYWKLIPMPDTESGRLFLGGGSSLVHKGRIICTAGVNGDIFEKAIRGEFDGMGYLKHDPSWYRFNPEIYEYLPAKEEWRMLGRDESMARAGAGIVGTKDGFILLNGELMPGVRSSTCTFVKLK